MVAIQGWNLLKTEDENRNKKKGFAGSFDDWNSILFIGLCSFIYNIDFLGFNSNTNPYILEFDYDLKTKLWPPNSDRYTISYIKLIVGYHLRDCREGIWWFNLC